ncbi:MAG: VWA domain-containing protein [Candidatus Marinimicrobia bacterium]|nr:VWA domain-containing protein [Candidatus Neomarinimicrobiota bacterium]MCF7840738.1 VWA domain-containing protein [Candidatus Neomarinimicrobiota bacterium]MCF7902765.1 VWA domain-containing protein [Candidatus Neomarinimicrobiota bacterium]
MMLTIKKINLVIFTLLCSVHWAFANGVAVVDAATQNYFQLDSSVVISEVEGDVAITTVRNVFINTDTTDTVAVFAFPIDYHASATGIRWDAGAGWNQATIISQAPTDTLPRSGPVAAPLKSYLGYAPFYFAIPDSIPAGQTLTVEFTYVELLDYSHGVVIYQFPNQYSLIQDSILTRQELSWSLTSLRTLDTLAVLSSQTQDLVNYSDNAASVSLSADDTTAFDDYRVLYRLSGDELGVFAYSTYLDPADLPDEWSGYFALQIEPTPYDTIDAMAKNFTLMIDRSGSMSGQKIADAKNAAAYIVSNLDTADHFNVIDISDGIGKFRPALVPFTPTAKDEALAFIAALDARGGTNLSGAFEEVIPAYTGADSTRANIVMFFSDGLPTSGITATNQLLNRVDELITATGEIICIYTLAIGEDVDWEFCTALAQNHNGFTQFVDPSDIIATASSFYQSVRSPVLIRPELTFTPADALTELNPAVTPNFFEGEQVLVSGRYTDPGAISLTITGTAFGMPFSQDFNFNLASSPAPENQFLMKIWAKQKIESLLFDYLLYGDDAATAQSLEEQISWLSLNYNIVSPFTSLSIPDNLFTGITDESGDGEQMAAAQTFQLLGNYPNPFNPTTTIGFKVSTTYHGLVKVKIYNALGQLARVLTRYVDSAGKYQLTWDGTLMDGSAAPSGTYIYMVDFGNALLGGRMSLIK